MLALAPASAGAAGPSEQHAALAKRVWSADRLDWWTAKPARRGELIQEKRLRRQLDPPGQKKARKTWKHQKRQFDQAWLKRLGGPSGVRWLLHVRICESGNNYRINTGNGFSGAYQFDASSWRGAGGRGLAYQAPPREQDYRAIVWRRIAGTGAWPNCG